MVVSASYVARQLRRTALRVLKIDPGASGKPPAEGGNGGGCRAQSGI
jgi:hypothetical protein